MNACLALGQLLKLVQHFGQRWRAETTDFTAFRTGWWLALHDPRHLYDAAAQATVQHRFVQSAGSPGFVNGLLAFLHPPQVALAGVWLAWLGDRGGGRVAALVWLACNLVLVAVLIRQVRRELGLQGRPALAAAAAIAGFFPLFDALSQGQFSVLLAVAAFGLAAALADRRPWQAAAWLIVLTFKPQLVPAVVAALLAGRQWRALGAAAVLAAGVVLLTGATLGAHIWFDWAVSVRALERAFGGGSPAVMPTLRGLLARTFPSLNGPPLETAGLALWGAGALAVWLVLVGDRLRGRAGDLKRALGFAVAVALVTSPHLYEHDLLTWIMPVTLALAVARPDRGAWRVRARALLACPAWALVSEVADQSDASWSRLPLDPRLIPIALALVWAVRARRANGPQ